MSLIFRVPSPEWDFPVFKVLAKNDTGSAASNQSGILIPKDLRRFFPGLAGETTASSPTVDRRIEAQLFVENEFLGTVATRYQFQTWGGTRSPESRVTSQLGPLTNAAAGGDVVVFQRGIDRFDFFRFILVRQASSLFKDVSALARQRRWGVLESEAPVSTGDLDTAKADHQATAGRPFSLFDSLTSMTTSTTRKVARSIVFRSEVIDQYREACAVCGGALRTPSGLIELDAAHVVPRSCLGADDVRNGLALCKRHHWAFDKGMFGVDDDRRVVIPETVAALPENRMLLELSGRSISEAKDDASKVHPDAFKWHRENIML